MECVGWIDVGDVGDRGRLTRLPLSDTAVVGIRWVVAIVVGNVEVEAEALDWDAREVVDELFGRGGIGGLEAWAIDPWRNGSWRSRWSSLCKSGM